MTRQLRNIWTVTVVAMVMACLGAASANAGLIGHWKFDDGAGTIAVDSSVNGNSATQASGGSWISGKDGGAYNLPRFTVTDSTDLQLVGAVNLTVSAWVKRSGTGNEFIAGIDGFATGGGDDMYALKTSSDKVLWYLKGVTTVTSTDTLVNYTAATADGWVHVVGVYEGHDRLVPLALDGLHIPRAFHAIM